MDQVPRMLRFLRDHPEITLTDPITTRSGHWTALRDGMVVCVRYDLGRLLDELDRLYRERSHENPADSHVSTGIGAYEQVPHPVRLGSLNRRILA